MSPQNSELLKSIESFDIDGGEAALPFAARLAREQGWSRGYADRAIREYKRYVFLAMCSDVPVCPSEDVDAAWHLHLTYTRSYWKRFCGDVLGRPLHHDPTRGGPAEADKHLKMYEATLAAYREAFGEEPPADIWPPAMQRFGDDIRHRMVNTARNWVIPKQPIRRVLQVAAALLLAAVVLPGCNGGLNPFDLKGTDFFYFYIPMLLGAIVLGRVIRSNLQGPDAKDGDDAVKLTWEQAAYLAGGYLRLTAAAIARLADEGIVRVADDRLEAGPPPTRELSAVEESIVRHLPFSKTEMKSIQDGVEARFGNQAAKLEEQGLAIAKPRQIMTNVGAMLPVALVILLFGVPRLLMGIANGKNVEYLVVSTVIGGIVGLIAATRGSAVRSHRAEYILDQHRKRNVSPATDAGLAVALFGTTILAGTAVAYLNDWYPRPSANSDSGCGTGCGTSGDGGGGCGGGGCGGCGGGGD